jgi:phage terminase large subunit-like protein
MKTRLKDLFDEHEVVKVAFDPWHFQTFRAALIRIGFTEAMIEAKFVEAPQSYKWMSPAVRSLETAIIEGKLRHGGNPCLTWCMSDVAIERNQTGERRRWILEPTMSTQ